VYVVNENNWLGIGIEKEHFIHLTRKDRKILENNGILVIRTLVDVK